MGVFSNYSRHVAGQVIKNIRPNVFVYPWAPTQTARQGTIRSQLAQPHERSASLGVATVNMSSGQAMQAARMMKTSGASSSGCGCGCKGGRY